MKKERTGGKPGKKYDFFRYLTGSNIRRQLRGIFLFGVLLPSLGFGIFAVFHARSQMITLYSSLVQSNCARVTSIVSDVTMNAYISADSIISSPQYMRLLGATEPVETGSGTEYAVLDDRVSAISADNAVISEAGVVTNNPNIPTGRSVQYYADLAQRPWYGMITNKQWRVWVTAPVTSIWGETRETLMLICRMGTTNDQYETFLIITLDRNTLKNTIGSNNYGFLLAAGNDPVFLASSADAVGEEFPMPDDTNLTMDTYTGSITIDGTKTLGSYRLLHPYQTDGVIRIDVTEPAAYPAINTITAVYLTILAAATIIPAVIIMMYSNYFSERTNTLKKAMHQARIGSYDIVDNVDGTDELSETFQDLKTTVEQIRAKDARYYEEKLERQQLENRQQQMEYKMLASQINPHFLYNTLETIRMQALAGGNREVAKSIKLLGKSMHYILENTGTTFTTLAKELDYIQNYLSIQHMRFGSRVNFTIDIDPEIDAEKCELLPLLIQPVVENAIVHGLENIDVTGIVTVVIRHIGDDLQIVVEDNGSGISAERLEVVQDALLTDPLSSASSIGLKNIRQRIILCYGAGADLTLDSIADEGTTVVITIPFERTVDPVQNGGRSGPEASDQPDNTAQPADSELIGRNVQDDSDPAMKQ